MIVTGGNRGLGAEIVGNFDGISISRENGYDITKDIDKIVELSLTDNNFVNNAFDGPPQEEWANFAQANLLIALFNRWKEEKCDGWIFNISSIASETIVPPSPSFETYRVSKSALDHASLQCSKAFKDGLVNFRTVLIKPDRLNTALSRSRDNWTGHGIHCSAITNFIEYCLTLDNNTNINQISISCSLNYKEK